MRSVVFTEEAERQLDEMINYIIDQGESGVALRLLSRVEDFTTHILADRPAIGRVLAKTDLRQMYVAGTPFVLWYRYTDDELTIISVFHERQDRDNSRPEFE